MKRFVGVTVLGTLFFAAACGGGGGGGGDGFSIQHGLAKVINVYTIDGGELGITWDADLSQVLGVASANGDAPQNFAGPATSSTAWNVTLHIADANRNGTVSDDVPFVAIGTGVLTNNGEHVEVHYRIPIEDTGIDVNINYSGDLARTETKSG